jgi:hypothetical protein
MGDPSSTRAGFNPGFSRRETSRTRISFGHIWLDLDPPEKLESLLRAAFRISLASKPFMNSFQSTSQFML